MKYLRVLLGIACGLVLVSLGSMGPEVQADGGFYKKTLPDGTVVWTNEAAEKEAKKRSQPAKAKSAGKAKPFSDAHLNSRCNYYGLDAKLVRCLIRQESGFRANVVSHKGAMGVMQLMPATAKRFGVTDPWDPQQNLEGGLKYLQWLKAHFSNNVPLTLAGYNAGENAVAKYGNKIPPYQETMNYVVSILQAYDATMVPQAKALFAKPGAYKPGGKKSSSSGPMQVWRYQDADGEWMYTNYKPDGDSAEKVLLIP